MRSADAGAPRLPPLPADPASVLVTASYAPDFERCRLLCETADRFVSGMKRHLILVEGRDVKLFRAFEGSRREVVDERDLLPSWLHAVDDPFSGFKRRVWLSLRTPPLRGWHVQQLRRIAVAAHVDEDLLVYCDSDVVFLRPFDCRRFAGQGREAGRARLYRADGALPPPPRPHIEWWNHAGRTLGVEAAAGRHDYISTLIAWRRDAAVAMRRHIEAVSGRHWAAAIAASRQFSECLLYGRFVDEVLAGDGHFADPHGFCRVHWMGEPLSDEAFRRFTAEMAPQEAAIGMQSFIGTDLGRIRRLLREQAPKHLPSGGLPLAS